MLTNMTCKSGPNARRQSRVGTPGHALVVRRTELGLSRKTIEDMTGGKVTEKTLGRYETGVNDLAVMNLDFFHTLLEVLQWTAADFQRATGTHVGAPDIPGSRAYKPTDRIPWLGTVTAGLKGILDVSDAANDMRPVDMSLPGLRGRPIDKLRMLTVNGDSMISDRAARNIPEGSVIVVELGAVPRPHDIVAAWLPEREAVVLKEYAEGAEAILRSFNPSGPVFRASEEPMEVRAVVRTVTYKAS